MEIERISTLPARLVLWQSGPGAWRATVVCKVTFALQPGTAQLADEQLEPLVEDEHFDGDPARSIYAPGDLVPAKARADVLVTGSAFAPAGKPASSLVARFIVGSASKAASVAGWRAVAADGQVQEGGPFAAMPLRYVNWRATPLPPDFDMAYFNVAPKEQQVDALSSTERIELHHLDAAHAQLVTTLPGIPPVVFLAERNGERLAVAADTLWIDTDRSLATLTFRGSMAVSDPKEALTFVVAVERADQALSWPQARAMRQGSQAEVGSNSQAAPGMTMDVPIGSAADGLSPFMRGALLPFGGAPTSTPAPRAAAATAVGLPFAGPANPAAAPPAAAPPATAPPAPPARASAPPSAPAMPAAVGGSPWAGGDSKTAQARVPAPVPSVDPLAQAATPRVAPAPSSVTEPEAEPASAAECYSLLWMHADCASRLRRVKAFRPLLEALDEQPVDWEADDSAPGADPMNAEDRREVVEVIAHARRATAEGVAQAVTEGTRADGRFVPQLVAVACELTTPYEARAHLKVTLATVSPLLAEDTDETPLGRAAGDAKRFLQEGVDALCPRSLFDGFRTRIEQAFADEERALPSDYLEVETGRALLENRKYDKRTLFGSEHLRTLCIIGSEDEPMPCYLPATLAAKLPLYDAFRVRLIAEALPQEDASETHPQALRALALARVIAR